MRKGKLKLKTKILFLNIIIIFISLIVTTIFVTKFRISSIERESEIIIMNTAETVANSKVVIEALEKKRTGGEIQQYVKEILNYTEKVDVVVVADMNGVRYAHPEADKVGKAFVGGDEKKVLQTGKVYISEAVGTLGGQIRAFVPVIDKNNNQLGFVMASSLKTSIEEEKYKAITTLVLISFSGFLAGIIGAVILSRSIKDSLLGFEPEQISKLYIQKKEVLDAMYEGIVAIDDNLKVILCNNAAIEMLKIEKRPILYSDIREIIPNSRLPMIIKKGVVEYNKEMIVNSTIILGSRIPIKEGSKIIGAVAIFRDKTEVTRLAEEVTGVKQVVEALRANTHEFKNKLHVILGLIQIGEEEKAKKYIIDQATEQQEKISLVMKKIKDPTIAALMIGKISRAKEAGINLHLDCESFLEKLTGRINSNSIITIIGNLIENSIESINLTDKNDKNINVLIKEEEENIFIEIEDSGEGIKEELLSKIFIRGFSTKGKNRGTGLSLVKDVVDNLKGTMEIYSKINIGTNFIIILPKEAKDDKSINSRG